MCGDNEHSEEACPNNKPSLELEAAAVAKARAHPASRPFRECRAQLQLALSQREEDPARVWLELVSVREHASKLPAVAADDPVLFQEIDRFRAKLEAEIFTLTHEVGDEVLAPLYVWVDLIRRRNLLDRDVLVSRSHVKQARLIRAEKKRAPRNHDEAREQLEAAQNDLDALRAECPPPPSPQELEVWNAERWGDKQDALTQDPNLVRARGVAARTALGVVTAGRRIGHDSYAGTPVEKALLGGAGAVVAVFTFGALLAILTGHARLGTMVMPVVPPMLVIAGVLFVVSWVARRKIRRERALAVDAVWHFTFSTERARAMEVEAGWLSALFEAFKARRSFDENKGEGKQIEDLKKWRPDLRDFVVEVAHQGDEAASAAAEIANAGSVHAASLGAPG